VLYSVLSLGIAFSRDAGSLYPASGKLPDLALGYDASCSRQICRRQHLNMFAGELNTVDVPVVSVAVIDVVSIKLGAAQFTNSM